MSGWVVLGAEAAMIGVLALHDWRLHRQIHPGTITVGTVLIACQLAIMAGGHSAWVASLAREVAAY